MKTAESTHLVQPPHAGDMSSMDMAWAMLADPRRAFAALRETPRFWFALLVSAALWTVFFVWYYNVVDIAWLADHMINSDPRMKAVSDADKATAAAGMSRSFLMWGSLLALVLGTAVLRLVEAAYFLLAGKATSLSLSFRHWLALTCWSAWPHVLSVLVMALALVMNRNGQIAPEQLNWLSLNELLFHTPIGHPWNTWLGTLTVLHPWAWWLTVLGVRQWSGRSWTYSAVLGLAPVAVLYGVWAAVCALG